MFLATSVSATPDFESPVEVPPDFTGMQLTIPHPANGVVYLKLRDDPETVQTLTLPITAMPATPEAMTTGKVKPSAPVADAPAAQPPAPQPPVSEQPAADPKGTQPGAITASSAATAKAAEQ